MTPRTCTRPTAPRRTGDVLDYWVERIGQVAPTRHNMSYSSMICESDRLYHYGRHFELGRIMRDKRGRTRLVLLNGDSYGGAGGFGPSTSSRQADARNAVQRTGATSLVVPFSALEGAGIDFDSIAPIHVREDRFTIEEHSSRKRPADLTTMPDPSGATKLDTHWRWNYLTHVQEQFEVEVPLRVPNPEQTRPFSAQHGWCEDGATLDEGVWRWEVRRHWLGDSIFRARCTESRTRKATAEELAEHERYLVWTAEHNRLADEERQHRGTAWRLDDRRRGFGGDYRAMTRAMFAAEGFRQRERRAQEASSEHGRTRVFANGVRGGRMPITVTHWATYLSSFDYQERRPLYFLCELPYRAKPTNRRARK